ncbi:MAG: hypothetical protein J7L98_05315 [Candidatus Verstraetearchaeota archaeon]|nr:hypothetical protein [Candidatus Verstraetearchaeota archaeon]
MLRPLLIALIVAFALLMVIPIASCGEVSYTLTYDDKERWVVNEHYAEGLLATVEWTRKTGCIQVFAQDLELGNGVNAYAVASASWVFKLTAPAGKAFQNASWIAYFHVEKDADPGSKVIVNLDRSGAENFQPPTTTFTIELSAELKAISFDSPLSGGGSAWAKVVLDRVEVSAYLVPLDNGGNGGGEDSGDGDSDGGDDNGDDGSSSPVRTCLVVIKTSPKEAGTTSPPPGKYYYSAGSRVTVSALPNEGWWFHYWSFNGKIKTKRKFTFIVDRNVTLIAHFEQYSPGVSLADVLRGKKISRAMPGEAVFIKVHLTMPSSEAGKPVAVRGYIDPAAALWWNGSSYTEQLGVFTKVATVQGNGTLDVLLGSPSNHWKIKPSLSYGSTYEIVVQVNESSYRGFFTVDYPTMFFIAENYRENGVVAYFKLRWQSDNSSISDRAGFFTVEIPRLKITATLNSSSGDLPVFISYTAMEEAFGSLGESRPTGFKALLTSPNLKSPISSCTLLYQPVGVILFNQQPDRAIAYTCLWPSLTPLPHAEVRVFWDSHLVGVSTSNSSGMAEVTWYPSLSDAASLELFKTLKLHLIPPKTCNVLFDPHHYGNLIIAIIP